MTGRHSNEEMVREYGPDERMLFADSYFAMTAVEAFRMGVGLVTLSGTGTYRRGCVYSIDEGPLISKALEARPTRSPSTEPSKGNKLR